MSSHQPRQIVLVWILALLACAVSGCCGEDDEEEPPPAELFNNTPYYLHMFHPDEVFLYVPPNGKVEVDVDTNGGTLLVATAAGQATDDKASGPAPQCCSTDCGSVSVGWSGGLVLHPTSPSCGGDGSCPHVYARGADGRFALQGEALTGALNRGATMADALILRGAARDRRGRYAVRIAAERQEREHIDAAWLNLVEHPPGTRLVLDRRGEPLALRSLAAPTRAVDAAGVDRRRAVSGEDQRRWIGALPPGSGARDHLQLAFRRPPRAGVVTLVLRARNTRFAEETYHAFLRELGPGLPGLMRLFSGMPLYRPTLDWMTRAGGLTLEVQQPAGDAWVTAVHIPLVGAAGLREIALRLPSTRSDGGTRLETLRLRALAGAWEIDSVRATFSPVAPVRRRSLSPERATRETGQREKPENREAAVVLDPGQHLTLDFAAPPAPRDGWRAAAVLRIVGYYELLQASRRPCLALGKLGSCFSPGSGNFAAFMRRHLVRRQQQLRAARRLLALERAGQSSAGSVAW